MDSAPRIASLDKNLIRKRAPRLSAGTFWRSSIDEEQLVRLSRLSEGNLASLVYEKKIPQRSREENRGV